MQVKVENAPEDAQVTIQNPVCRFSNQTQLQILCFTHAKRLNSAPHFFLNFFIALLQQQSAPNPHLSFAHVSNSPPPPPPPPPSPPHLLPLD